MSNLPKNIYPAVKAFKGADYTLRLQMFEGFTPPGVIVTEVRDKSKLLYTIPSEYNAEDNKIEVTWTASQLQKLGAINEFYIRFDNDNESSVYRFGGQIKPSWNPGDIENDGYSVTAEYYVIEVLGVDIVKGQADIATTQAEIATTSASTATTQATIASAKAIEASDLATAANSAKTGSETARDSAIAAKESAEAAAVAAQTILIRKKDSWVVNTKAELTTLIATPNLNYCDICVLADESYGGLYCEYFWDKTRANPKLTY